MKHFLYLVGQEVTCTSLSERLLNGPGRPPSRDSLKEVNVNCGHTYIVRTCIYKIRLHFTMEERELDSGSTSSCPDQNWTPSLKAIGENYYGGVVDDAGASSLVGPTE